MIVINIEKAKSVGHQIRRAKRAEELAPLDALVALNTPGTDLIQIESQRQTIRDRYAEMQSQIDSAQTPEQIKAALRS